MCACVRLWHLADIEPQHPQRAHHENCHKIAQIKAIPRKRADLWLLSSEEVRAFLLKALTSLTMTKKENPDA
jgi:hypothetical protein